MHLQLHSPPCALLDSVLSHGLDQNFLTVLKGTETSKLELKCLISQNRLQVETKSLVGHHRIEQNNKEKNQREATINRNPFIHTHESQESTKLEAMMCMQIAWCRPVQSLCMQPLSL